MRKKVAVPTISSDGWIVDPVRALDRLLAYFFESDKSQTYCYGDNIHSLAWLYTTYVRDPDNLATEITKSLTNYLDSYYETADVACRANSDTNNPNKVELSLAVSVVTTKGERLDMAKLIVGNNTKILEILNHLNN